MEILLKSTLDLIAPKDEAQYKRELAKIERAERQAKRELAEESTNLKS